MRAFFGDGVFVTADGTDAPEIFVIEEIVSGTTSFQVQLLTSGPGETPVIAATVQVYSVEYSDVGGDLGGMGIDLDALGLGGIRGIQIPGIDGLGGVSDIHPAVIAAVTTTCKTPFADIDGDMDVDQADLAAFQRCYTGPTPGGSAWWDAGCSCFDHGDDNQDGVPDEDTDTDAFDYAAFENCATGPGIPWSQQMTPNCNP